MTVHIVPIRLKAPATIEAVFAGPMRYGAPTMLGASGHYTASREPIWIIAFEWPDALPITDKAAKEQLHLNRFLADFEAGLQRPPYRTVRRGPDPPDFICTEVDGGQVGVELTQLMVEDRVEASAQFGRLKKAILVAGPSRFAKVQGHVVYVAFDSESGEARPPAQSDAVARVVGGLADFEPVTLEGSDLPEQLDLQAVRQFEGGRITAAQPHGGSP